MELPAIYFKTRYRAGEPGYYDGRQRGTVAVYSDSSLWLYHQPPKSFRRQFKAELELAFNCKLTGRWPEYREG